MRGVLAVLIVLLAAALAAWFLGERLPGWLPFASQEVQGELAGDFDVSLIDVETVLLVAGPPDDRGFEPAATGAALAAFADELRAGGFAPAMRRGGRPRPTLEVVQIVAPDERSAPGSLPAGLADCSIWLALEELDVERWDPPSADAPGRVRYRAAGRVWVLLPADGSVRRFVGDFEGTREREVEPADLARAPADTRLAAAHLFGAKLLETWRLGVVWRSILEDEE